METIVNPLYLKRIHVHFSCKQMCTVNKLTVCRPAVSELGEAVTAAG